MQKFAKDLLCTVKTRFRKRNIAHALCWLARVMLTQRVYFAYSELVARIMFSQEVYVACTVMIVWGSVFANGRSGCSSMVAWDLAIANRTTVHAHWGLQLVEFAPSMLVAMGPVFVKVITHARRWTS